MTPRRIILALVAVLVAPVAFCVLVVTIATVKGYARPIGRTWRDGLAT
jgi:Na+/H+-dicarboxylate symporter